MSSDGFDQACQLRGCGWFPRALLPLKRTFQGHFWRLMGRSKTFSDVQMAAISWPHRRWCILEPFQVCMVWVGPRFNLRLKPSMAFRLRESKDTKTTVQAVDLSIWILESDRQQSKQSTDVTRLALQHLTDTDSSSYTAELSARLTERAATGGHRFANTWSWERHIVRTSVSVGVFFPVAVWDPRMKMHHAPAPLKTIWTHRFTLKHPKQVSFKIDVW